MKITRTLGLKPAFHAQFSKDKETRQILNNRIDDDGTGAGFVYKIISLLNDINSKDSISLSTIEVEKNNVLIVRNENTGNKIHITSRHNHDNLDFNLPKILTSPSEPEYKKLFGERELKSAPIGDYEYDNILNTKLKELSGYNKLEREKEVFLKKNEELELEIEQNVNKISHLDEEQYTINQKYVKSLINGDSVFKVDG